MSIAGRTWLPTWRALVTVSLLLGYLALTGEAIHCQFVPTGHKEHQGRSSQRVSHATPCCLLANHSTFTLATPIVVTIPVLQPTGLLGEGRHHLDVAPRFTLLPARAPPAA